jgi:hypothetical protein
VKDQRTLLLNQAIQYSPIKVKRSITRQHRVQRSVLYGEADINHYQPGKVKLEFWSCPEAGITSSTDAAYESKQGDSAHAHNADSVGHRKRQEIGAVCPLLITG